MVFQEPKIEFVSLSLQDIASTSGAAASVCQKVGGQAMNKDSFCSEWAEYGYDAEMPWNLICSMVEEDESIEH